MPRKSLPRLVLLAAATFVLFSIGMLFATQVYSAWEVDREAREHAEEVVGNGFGDYSRWLAAKAVPQAYWDDAVVKLDNHFDPRWASVYIGNYFWQTAGFEIALVIDRNGKVVFASHEGKPMSPRATTDALKAAQPLIALVRKAEAKRPPPIYPIPDGWRIDNVESAAPARVAEDPFLMSATLVQPDTRARLKGSRAPIIVLGKQLDETLLQQISQRFALENPRLFLNSPPTGKFLASITFDGIDGRRVAGLSWTPSRPGQKLLEKVAPALMAFALLILIVSVALWNRGQRLIRSLVESESQANRLAYSDPLTGLPNRTMLDREFARRVALLSKGESSFAVHCIDLDMFKSVNDSFGHLAGDELIRLIGDRLRNLCRPDDFLVRFGGDEFVILQSNARRARATRLAKRVVSALAEPVQLEAGRVIVGASVGIVICLDPELSPEEYLRRSDMALYRAKEIGRSTHVFFDPVLDQDLRSRQKVRTHLHDALNQGDLKLEYQPQVSRDGQVVGVEALARWTHGELGVVPASEFVEIAEESGLIDSLGQFTMRQAFEDSRRWPGLTLAVNVSAMQLRQRNFPDWLKSLADELDVDPRRVELEITERVLIGDDIHTQQLLYKLKRYGFRIVLDDFGTGYSSLGYLQRYPIDKVKIDRSFVARIGIERGAEAIVVAIVRLAKALGLEVVAEGVETEAQRLCLSVAGCSIVQGYLTGRPVDADLIDPKQAPASRIVA